jgi:hypothetical protein
MTNKYEKENYYFSFYFGHYFDKRLCTGKYGAKFFSEEFEP